MDERQLAAMDVVQREWVFTLCAVSLAYSSGAAVLFWVGRFGIAAFFIWGAIACAACAVLERRALRGAR